MIGDPDSVKGSKSVHSVPLNTGRPRGNFRQATPLAKNLFGFRVAKSPFYGHFGVSPNLGRRRSVSAMQDSAYLKPHPRGRPSAPASRGSSRASTPTAFASTPQR